MKSEMVWKNVDRAIFLTKFVSSVCNEIYLYNITSHAHDYKMGANDWLEKMSCEAYGYTYEFNTTLGTYRFKYNKYGPWTKWMTVEGV